MNKEKVFCIVLMDFIRDVYASYPDPALGILITTTQTMIYTSPTMVVKNFMYCVQPYKEKIKRRDSSFFLDGDLIENVPGDYDFLKTEIIKVITIWNDPITSEKTKESIWKYFEVLVKLGETICM